MKIPQIPPAVNLIFFLNATSCDRWVGGGRRLDDCYTGKERRGPQSEWRQRTLVLVSS